MMTITTTLAVAAIMQYHCLPGRAGKTLSPLSTFLVFYTLPSFFLCQFVGYEHKMGMWTYLDRPGGTVQVWKAPVG